MRFRDDDDGVSNSHDLLTVKTSMNSNATTEEDTVSRNAKEREGGGGIEGEREEREVEERVRGMKECSQNPLCGPTFTVCM